MRVPFVTKLGFNDVLVGKLGYCMLPAACLIAAACCCCCCLGERNEFHSPARGVSLRRHSTCDPHSSGRCDSIRPLLRVPFTVASRNWARGNGAAPVAEQCFNSGSLC